MKPLVRWTIGNVEPAGYECLAISIDKFRKLYDVDVVVCHNCDPTKLQHLPKDVPLYDQRKLKWKVKPEGVSWKLYPPRLTEERHELLIDNDIIIEERIEEIDHFFKSDCTLLLEDEHRVYGRFNRHVPHDYHINSGVYGMPPNFSLQKYIDFYVKDDWKLNAEGPHAASKTFDEQGLVALSLLNYKSFAIIPLSSLTICELHYKRSKGMHFIGLNRQKHHSPFYLYKSDGIKFYL